MSAEDPGTVERPVNTRLGQPTRGQPIDPAAAQPRLAGPAGGQVPTPGMGQAGGNSARFAARWRKLRAQPVARRHTGR